MSDENCLKKSQRTQIYLSLEITLLGVKLKITTQVGKLLTNYLLGKNQFCGLLHNKGIVVTATDKAGRVTTVTRTITLDSSSTVIAPVVIDPNPVNIGENYTVTIKVTG